MLLCHPYIFLIVPIFLPRSLFHSLLYSFLLQSVWVGVFEMARLFSRLSFLFSLATLSHAAPLEEISGSPTVTIASGVVIGTATPVPNQPSNPGLVNSYLGIPFAQSPPLRFAPPQPETQPWTSPLQATSLKPACIQQFIGPEGGKLQNNIKFAFNNPGGAPPAESEDCLYLVSQGNVTSHSLILRSFMHHFATLGHAKLLKLVDQGFTRDTRWAKF